MITTILNMVVIPIVLSLIADLLLYYWYDYDDSDHGDCSGGGTRHGPDHISLHSPFTIHQAEGLDIDDHIFFHLPLARDSTSMITFLPIHP